MSNAPATLTTKVKPDSNRGALVTVTSLFFMWGFLTCLNDILIPHLKSIFELNYAEAMLIQFSFFSAYFVFSLPSGRIIRWIGYKRTMVAGLLTMGVGALSFILAASMLSFPLFLTALIIVAAGITALQVAANPYVAVLGPAETAPSRLNLTQAFNSLGTFVAPYLGSLFILREVTLSTAQLHGLSANALQAYRLEQAGSVKLPYLAIGLALLALGVIIAKSHLPTLSVERESLASGDTVWKHRHLVLGAIAIFVYVGGEVSIGSFLVNYLGQSNIGNMSAPVAAKWVSLYWGGAMVGRFIGSMLLRRVPAGRLVGLFALAAAVLVSLSMVSLGTLAVVSILAVGLFNSIMFPSIFTLAIDGLGALTSKGSALLCAAIVGGAIIPEMQGLLADRIGIHHAFVLPVLCYLYILFYGFRGCRRTAYSG